TGGLLTTHNLDGSIAFRAAREGGRPRGSPSESLYMEKVFLATLALTLIAQPAADAGAVAVSGFGTWGPDAPTSIYTAPGESWSFSFDLPDPLDANPASMAAHFQYFLDGSAVTTTLTSVEFFPADQGGLFDLNFADGNSLNLYGAPAYSGPGL